MRFLPRLPLNHNFVAERGTCFDRLSLRQRNSKAVPASATSARRSRSDQAFLIVILLLNIISA